MIILIKRGLTVWGNSLKVSPEFCMFVPGLSHVLSSVSHVCRMYFTCVLHVCHMDTTCMSHFHPLSEISSETNPEITLILSYNNLWMGNACFKSANPIDFYVACLPLQIVEYSCSVFKLPQLKLFLFCFARTRNRDTYSWL